MKASRDTRARLAALVAQGVLSAETARAALAATVEGDELDICMVCGSDALLRDYICGSCSMLKVRNERKFWELVRSGPEPTYSRKTRPCSAQTAARATHSTDAVVVDQAEIRRMVDTLEIDLTLLSWREAFIGSIPESQKEMYERERLSVESQRALTGRLLSFWTLKLDEETIGGSRVSAGEFPAGATAVA